MASYKQQQYQNDLVTLASAGLRQDKIHVVFHLRKMIDFYTIKKEKSLVEELKILLHKHTKKAYIEE